MLMIQFKTQLKLNVLAVGSYDVLIGMERLEKHRVVLICFEKTFTCLDEKGEIIIVKGIPIKAYVRKIMFVKVTIFLLCM